MWFFLMYFVKGGYYIMTHELHRKVQKMFTKQLQTYIHT